MEKIESFSDDYRFLSNFFLTKKPIVFGTQSFPSTEHAYQAAKFLDLGLRQRFLSGTPGNAKRLADELRKQGKVRADWVNVRESIMLHFLRQKFYHTDLMPLLLETGNAELIEGNWWGDTFWGVYNGYGKNRLGKLLMQVREECRGLAQIPLTFE